MAQLSTHATESKQEGVIRVWYRGRAAEGGAAGGGGASGTGAGGQGGGSHQGGSDSSGGDQAGEGEEGGEGAEQDAESEARLNALNRETESMLNKLGNDPTSVTDEELTSAEKTYANLLAQNPDNAEVKDLYERIVALRQARTNSSSVLPGAPTGTQQGTSTPAPTAQAAEPSFAPLDTFSPTTILQTAPAPAPTVAAVTPNVSQHAISSPIASATRTPVTTLRGPVSQPMAVTASRPQPQAPTQTTVSTAAPAGDGGNLPIYRPSNVPVAGNTEVPQPPGPAPDRAPASQPASPTEATVSTPSQTGDTPVVSRRTYEDTRGNSYPTAAEAAVQSGLPPPPPSTPVAVFTSVTVSPATTTAAVPAEPQAPVAVAVEPPSYEPVAAPSAYAALPDPVDAVRAFTPVVPADPEPAVVATEARFVETGRGIVTTGGMEPISFDDEPSAPVRAAAAAVTIRSGTSVAFAENSYNPPPAVAEPVEEPFVDFQVPRPSRAPVKLIGGMPAISATPPETPSRAIAARAESEGLGQFADFIRVELKKSVKAPIPAAKKKKPAPPPPAVSVPPAQGFLSKLISRFLF